MYPITLYWENDELYYLHLKADAKNLIITRNHRGKQKENMNSEKSEINFNLNTKRFQKREDVTVSEHNLFLI